MFTAPIYEINCFVKIQAYRIGMIFLDKTGSGKLVSPLPVMNWQGAFYVCTGSLTEYLMLAAITTHPAIRPGPHIGTGLGDHQHTDHGDGIGPKNNGNVEPEAQHDGHPHPAKSRVVMLLGTAVEQHDDQQAHQCKRNVTVNAAEPVDSSN